MADVISITRQDGSVELFASAASAFATLSDGDYIQLLDDCTCAQTTINKNVALNLNGHVLTGTGGSCVFHIVVGGNLTVKDDSEESTGEIVHPSESVIYLTNKTDTSKRPVFTFEAGTIQAQEFGVCVFGGAVVNILGGTIIAKDNGAVGSNGSAQYSAYPYEINISGGDIFANTESAGYANCAVYHANAGKVNISGGNIVATSGAGVVVRAGSLNVTGGHIEGQGDSEGLRMGDANPTYCGGIEFCNSANYPGKMATQTISGGEIVSLNNYGVLVIGDPADYPNAEFSRAVISSGQIKGGDGAIGYVTKDNEPIEEAATAKLTVVGGSFNSDVNDFIDPSVNLSVEYDSDGNPQYVIKDGMKAVISYLDSILDRGIEYDEAEIEKLGAAIEAIEEVATKVDTTNEELVAIKGDLAEAKAKIASIFEQAESQTAKLEGIQSDTSDIKADVADVKSDISDVKVDVSDIKADASDIKSDVSDVKSTTQQMASDVSDIKAKATQIESETASIKTSTASADSKLDAVMELQKAAVEEIAKIAGDDPDHIIPDDMDYTAIQLKSFKSMVLNAKRGNHTEAIWQHPITDNIREYIDAQGYQVELMPESKLGEQWIIHF